MQSSTKKIHLSDDAYNIIGNIYDAISQLHFGNTPFKGLKTIEVLQKMCGISHYAAQKAIEYRKKPSEASERQPVGRPRRLLDPEYSSTVEEIILNNNKAGKINTVMRTLKVLKESQYIKVSYSALLRDIHQLGFKYQKGIRRNILHDAPTNIMYRQVYLNNRLANLNGVDNPIMPEVFLDESYCHVDHSAKCTWVKPRGYVNESGRKPMLVIFAAFVVFKNNRERKAKIIEESVHVWPVSGGERIYTDYHGYFNAEKFERLFETLCQALQRYGPCVIHMDGASYHKRRINSVPTNKNRKDEIINWLKERNIISPAAESDSKVPKKDELLNMIKDLHIRPQYATFDIANKYDHKILITPPYHPAVQPIEKVWAIIKNPIAYNPDPEETVSSLQQKLVLSLNEVTEESLISIWRKAIQSCKDYQKEFDKEIDPLDFEDEQEDVEIASC
jgi:transposase